MIMIIITMFTLSLFISTSHTAPLTFNITNFDKCSNNSIKVFESASCGDSGVQLTSSDYYTTGQAHYSKPMRLWDASTGNITNFNTNFTFSMDNDNGTYTCDGLAFFIASFNYTTPANASEGRLGLVNSNHQLNSKGINPFVAVEFDTYYDSGWDTLRDIHVGIDVNSIKSVASKKWRSYSNGTTMSANVSYKAKNLCVEFTGLTESREVGGKQAVVKLVDVPEDTLCYEIDLMDYLTEWAVFGFSASTAFRYQSHTLKTWSFYSDLDSAGGPSIVKTGINQSNTQTGKKTNRTVTIGLAAGIIGGLVILILAGTAILARSNKKSVPDLRSDSGCRSPDGFLATRKDRSTSVK